MIPFAAGGDSDLSGRNVALHAQKYLNNQPIVAVNRVGASGTIGAAAVRCGLAFVAVVGNDSCWNAEYQIQLRCNVPPVPAALPA